MGTSTEAAAHAGNTSGRWAAIVESANAMAHTPLFASLDRVELAKLAAELEEQHFAAGEYVMREGEPGRDFYVIKSGTVEIFTGERPRSGPRNFHTSPTGFGEVALLLHSARTTSVVACTDLTVWRLSGERFGALLTRERPIAHSIERALALRVAAVSREAADFRSSGECLTEHALDSLSADTRRLLLRVGRLPRWPAATLARLCEASGAALAFRELDQRKVFVPGEGDTYEVNPMFEGTDHTLDRSDCRWMETAVEHLIADREVASAIELALGAEMADMVARLLAAHRSAVVTRVPVDRLTSWLALAGRSSVAVREQLEQLRAEAEARPVAARPVSTVDAPGSNIGQPHPGPFRARIPSRRVFAILLAVLLLVLGWLVPEPSGLSREALITLAAVLATVPLLGMNALPRSAVAVLLVAALVAPGIIRPSVALAGFASPIWLLIFALACVAAAIARSGLIYRLALLSLERLPPSYVVQSLLLSLMGLLVTAGITSGLARISIGVPAARGIAEAMAYEPRSRGSAALGLVTFLVFSQMETLFLTSSTGNLVLFDLMPEVARHQVSWTGWLIAGLAPHVLLLAVVSVAIALMFRPPTRARVDARSIQLQKQLLGPLTRQEILAIAALVVLVSGFATRNLHHVDGVWIAVGLLIALYLGGRSTRPPSSTASR